MNGKMNQFPGGLSHANDNEGSKHTPSIVESSSGSPEIANERIISEMKEQAAALGIENEITPANENHAPDYRPLFRERPPGALDILKERGIDNVHEEMIVTGDYSGRSREQMQATEDAVEKLLLKDIISAINNSTIEDWRKDIALYITYVNKVREYRKQIQPDWN